MAKIFSISQTKATKKHYLVEICFPLSHDIEVTSQKGKGQNLHQLPSLLKLLHFFLSKIEKRQWHNSQWGTLP